MSKLVPDQTSWGPGSIVYSQIKLQHRRRPYEVAMSLISIQVRFSVYQNNPE